MNRRSVSIAIAVAAWSALLSGRAQAVVIYGDGIPSCRTWSASPNDAPLRRAEVAWLLGYVSAYDWYAPNGEEIKYTDPGSMVDWVDRYCAAHPQDVIAAAAARLIDELRHRRGLPALMSPN
jgi:hypothetical protein